VITLLIRNSIKSVITSDHRMEVGVNNTII